MVVWRQFSLQLIPVIGILLMVACTPVKDNRAPEPARQQADTVMAPAAEPARENAAVEHKADVIERQPEPQSRQSNKPTEPAMPVDPTQPVEQPVKSRPPVKTARPTIPAAPAPLSAPGQIAPVAKGVVNGRIRLLGKSGEILDSSGVIINLQPVTTIPLEKKPAKEHFISMVDKTYTPAVLTVKTEDTLSFINGDKIKHNVFSSSGDNTFDLGTYGTGKTRGIKLGNSGVVKVYCNIHPEMAAFVNVSEHNIATITGSNGDFEISAVPVGQYKVMVWHVRGEMERDLTVKAGMPAKLELIMDTSSYQSIPHKNKFGKDYKKKPALFEDEFY